MASNSPELLLATGWRYFVTLALLTTVYLVLDRVREYHRLRRFKGPTTSGISWWWHSKAVISGRAHEYYGDVTEKYGM
jgi:hypothetical protein